MDQRSQTAAGGNGELNPTDPTGPTAGTHENLFYYRDRIRGITPSVHSFISDVNSEIFRNRSHTSNESHDSNFNILENSSSSENSIPRASLASVSSGATIYADASPFIESPGNDSSRMSGVDHLRDHMDTTNNGGPDHSQGLIRIQPIQASFRLSHVTSDDDFEFEQSRRGGSSAYSSASPIAQSSMSPPAIAAPSVVQHQNSVMLQQDEARTTTVLSPATPRSRKRSPLTHISSSEMNARRSLASNDPLNSPVPLNYVQARINRKGTVPPSQEGISIVLGRPRDTSNGSSVSTQSQRTVSSDGHLLPERKVNEPRLSFIRRAGATTLTNNAFLVGFPKLPHFPGRQVALPYDTRPGLVTSMNSGFIERDLWGRQTAGKLVSWLILILFTFFPPLLLFLGAGYFDRVFGTIHRSAKIAAFVLTLLTLLAGTALVIAFSVLRW